MAEFSDAALILAGHGSTVNGDSSRPAWEQAERIKAMGHFAEVHVGLWKEQPSFREALAAVRARKVYIVPLFTAEGYFTNEILPREFGLEGRVTSRQGREIVYCDPIGGHPYMLEALLKSAQAVLAGTPVDPATTCLLVAGHGTPRNPNSKAVVMDVVGRLRALGLYGDCQGAFMEEAPFLKDWPVLTDCRQVVVVPYFISDGLHSFEDIPVMLGISANVREEGFRNPTHLHGRRIWYARALGGEPRLAEVVLALVRDAARCT
ncbi:MAG: CbiX/SirB N-terminal domain-containing protein [Candidatus Methylacidiphilales bacterium]|nr:CbiX/SirB N-terminal domain-containing protein [Candidatus Methylacidiphilales bacterium]